MMLMMTRRKQQLVKNMLWSVPRIHEKDLDEKRK
jgi:hypothetical protein